MRQVATWLEDTTFKRYKNHVEKLNTNLYQHTRKLILTDLGDEKAVVVRTTIIYLFTLYALVASVIVLVF